MPIQWRNKQIWQMTLYTDKQAFQENLKTLSELKKRIQELFQIKYKQLNFFGTTEDIELKLSKKGKILLGRHKHATNAIQTQKHKEL